MFDNLPLPICSKAFRVDGVIFTTSVILSLSLSEFL